MKVHPTIKNRLFPSYLLILIVFLGCSPTQQTNEETFSKTRVVFDTDANNELDDQHALAYLLLNGEDFIVKGVTVNATFNGGDIEEHYREADRIIRLCDLKDKIPLYKGANGSFPEIRPDINNETFDGSEAVDFIIETAIDSENELVLLAVGKLTNPALALIKRPEIAPKIRIVWLGSNYPEPGEYNQINDTSALNYLLGQKVRFEMVTVRYGKPSGTDAVKITQQEVYEKMPGLGPIISESVTGRHGGSYTNFGDYAVSLFENSDYYGEPPSRALFDMAAVAIVKNADWADYKNIPAPVLIDGQWKDRPDNKRVIGIWENFEKEKILNDFYYVLSNFDLVSQNN